SPFPSGSNSVHIPVGCSDQHLQPIASLSPNSLASQAGSVFSQSKFESEKCNGVVGDLSYPPILPKVPGSPSPTKDRTTKSPRKSQALDREARNERRRQQRLKKKQEEAAQQTSGQMTLESYREGDLVSESIVLGDSLRQSRPRARKKTTDFSSGEQLSGECGSATERDTEKLSTVATSVNDVSASPTKSKKRRNSTRLILPKQPKKNKIQLVETQATLEAPGAPDDVLSFTQEQSPVTEPAGESMDAEESTKHVKIVKTRPPRPKKKKPLPTLIRKKKRSAFYGDESDSEPDVSGRLGGRTAENRSSAVVSDNSSHDRKRRSERTAGDRKRYTIDLDLNLSDDSDGPGNDEMATLNSDSAAGMVEENDMKVVEYVLGRRVTKRVVKKVIQRHILKDAEPADSGSEVAMETIEEEDEEDVEEFYLKYKGYSYLHCEWRALDEIDDPRIRPKLRRFEMKQASIVQQEDDDVVLFNPDYVEVERVLDMKVYRNGQLISSDKLRAEVERTDLNVDLIELRKQRKRERERKRARALREAKARAKAEAEGVLANQTVLRRPALFTEGSETTSRDATETTVGEVDHSLCEASSSHLSQSESVAELPVTMPEGEDDTPSRSSPDRTVPQPLVIVDPNSVDSNEPSDTTVDEVAPLTSTLVAETPTGGTTANVVLPRSVIKNSDDDCENGEDSDRGTGTRSPVNVTYYLVKWRSLPYEDATWELAQDVDPAKVKEFLKWRIPPKVAPVARDNDYKIIRPDTSTWRPIEAGIVYKNSNKLRDYQLEGVNWLTFCWFHHRNCILADEMGLGKTVQSVAFLLEIEKTGVRGPFLIIVPLSTVANWQREFENWSDLNVVVYHGSSTSRNMIQEYEIFYKRRPSDSTVRHDVYKFHALVTTFEILMTDIEFFGQIHWAAAVIDEAHRLKNKKCKLGEGLRYLELDHRVLLTGTPLQNNVEELFGLLNFLEPERFNCSSTFVAEYGDLKTEEQVESLKALLKPMMLRRLKEDVEKSLAPKEETIVEVELTNMQKKYYRAIMERNFTFLCKGSTYANAPNLMNVMMELRKCCNHPFLIKGAEEAILDEMRAHQNPDENMSDDLQTFHALVYASGKLVLIHKLLPKLKANGHKVLIFSQMIRVLDILEDYLIHQRFQFERIDGRIHGPLRQEAIDRFTADPDKFVFLLCTKAGGLGINLTAADVVIIYDSDWNPQNDLQAQARCHRIGQQKMVKVYRLITRNTYEREMFDRASLKLGLDRAVLQSMGSKEARQAQMSKKEIEELLKKGAYGALMEDDKAGEDFCEEDIDKILQSRSRVVQLEQGEKNSTFSKDLIMKTPRQRRQTSRYSAVDVTEPVVHSPPSYDASELEDSANAQSSGEENVVSTSGGRGRFRRCRRQRRHSRLPSHVSAAERRASQTSLTADIANTINRGDSCRMEALDRADLFRVERCLLTWPWGDWERGLSMIPFKRALKPADLGYYASALLAYALRFMPPSGDTRIRTTILTLTRPHVWNLSIMEVSKAVAKATSRASRGCRFVDEITVEPLNVNEAEESCILKSEIPSNTLDTGVESPSTTDAPGTPALSQAASVDVHDTPVVTENDSEVQDPVSESTHGQTFASPVVTVLELTGEPDTHDFIETSILPAVEEPMESQTAMDLAEIQSTTSEKPELEELESAVNENINKTTANKSPKSACFDPDILLPCDGFRKHMQRHSARLLNRVAFLLFLQCEVIGVEPSLELMAGRLTHTDFSDLAASLPPLEAIDSELPAPWWDCCCDKCLLLGILKHGWEKYTLMRLDPDLCFYSRAMARLNELTDSKPPDSDSKIISNEIEPVIMPHEPQDTGLEGTTMPETTLFRTSDYPALITNVEHETHESDEDIKTEKHLSPMVHSKGKLESEVTLPSTPLSEKHIDHVKFEEDQPIPEEETVLDGASVDAVLTALPFPAVADLNSRARKLVGFFLRIKNQLEFDTHRRFTAEDEEDLPGQPSTVRYVENRAVKWTRREEADFYRVVSSFGVEFTQIPYVDSASADEDTAKPTPPVKRRYRWHNFRQLANITRKNDDALTEYFQSFYRMCQRVCKRTLTEFAGPASSAATTTTSGSSSLGDEVPIEPISEERANRCLSRIDLLARIRNDVLPHPQLNERLKLCQRGSEIPSWWIPGKHDGELLRAAAKHGLARTDLNILSDPEFSFCHVVSEIREKLSRETVPKSCSSVLSNGSSNRSDVANIVVTVGAATVTSPTVQKTFRSKAVDLQTENSASSAIVDSCNLVVDESAYDSLKAAHYKEILDEETLKSVENGASKLGAKKDSIMAKIDAKSDDNVLPVEIRGVQKESNESLDLPFSELPHDVKNKEESVGSDVPEADEIRKDSVPVPFSNGSKPEEIAKHVPCTELADWSIKYATAWPKDRTIQHRLELVCQAVEANEWPVARRYLPTPSAASIPVPDPNRALNEAKLMSFTSTYSTIRHPAHSAFPIPLSMHGALQPSYGLLHVNNGKHLPNVPRPLPLDTPKHMVSFSNALLRNSSGAVEDRTSKLLNPVLNESINFESISPLNLASQSSPSFEGFTTTRTQIPSSSHSSAEFKKSANVPFSTGTSSSPSYSSPATGSATPPRGRGRGRGRGSRGGLGSRALNARERLSASSSINHQEDLLTQDSSPPSPLSGTDLTDRIGPSVIKDPLKRMGGRTPTDLDDHTTLDRSPVPPMPPPSVASAPRSLSVGRGRKRRMDASRNSADFPLSATKITPQSKRDRLTQSTTGADYPSKTSKSSTRGSASHSTNSDVWEVRVPVISLVDGSLIYGDKAPKRRVLEAWLEANPNYMPYSVEMEDRIIYSRVAGARGQDTNNMEALAYKHYLNSLIASAAAGLHQTSSSTASSVLPSTSSTSKTGTTVNTQQQQQQQLLQFQQQQQLLQAFGAYARHPAYASLIASALGTWQAANLSAVSTSASFLPTSSESVSTGHSGRLTGNATSSIAATTSAGSAAVCSTSMSTRTRAAAKLLDSPIGHQDLSPPSECSALGTSSSRPASPTPETSSTNATVVTHNTMESVLSAAYKQATANLAYMYNPLAAAAAYNQMFLPSAGSLTTGSDTTGKSSRF
ncbi:chromodomain-helicase-DNA-binding protein 7, partial [Paragonimus westermani]